MPCRICPCTRFSTAVPTARERAVLDQLPTDAWVRPMDVGGRDGSGHSYTLAILVAKGLAERESRGGLVGIRASYVYRRKAVAV